MISSFSIVSDIISILISIASIFISSLLASITVVSSFILALITWYYAKTTKNILTQSQKDTKIAYIRSRLENYYYPIHYFLSQCYIETENGTFSLSEIEYENICLDEKYIDQIKRIYFKSKNRLLFNEIHKFQYLGTSSTIKDTDIFVSMIRKRLKKELDKHLPDNKLIQAKNEKNHVLSENRTAPSKIIFDEKDEIILFCSYFNNLKVDIENIVKDLQKVIE